MSLATVQYVRFDESSKAHIEELGLDYNALKRIFLCAHLSSIQCELALGTPKIISDYQNREARASSYIYEVIRNGYMHFLSPLSLKPVTCNQTEVPAWSDKVRSKFYFVPLLYFFNDNDDSFWLVSCDITARVVLMYIPKLRLAIYEINLDRAKSLVEILWCDKRADDLSFRAFENKLPILKFAILDMVFNYGHQVINHLSGLEEVRGQNILEDLDEILIAGTEFFSDTRVLYPELKHKIKKFADRESLTRYLSERKFIGVKLGSTYFRRQTRKLILDQVSKSSETVSPVTNFPVIAVNVRSGDRRCLNLVQMIHSIYNHFQNEYPKIAFIIDGWVFPDCRSEEAIRFGEASDRALPRSLKDELDETSKIIAGLPQSAVLDSLVGLSMSDSLNKLRRAHVYFSHVGTLHHKLSFFHIIPGLVHGPKDQLKILDSGSFSSTDAFAPIFLAPEMVIDNSSDNRSKSRSNYEITDIQGCLSMLSDIIKEAKSSSHPYNPI